MVTLVWFSQRPQCDAHDNQRVQEASQEVRANQGVAFPDEFAARCYHGARDVEAGCLRLIGHSPLGPAEAAARIGSASVSPGPSPGGVLTADSLPRRSGLPAEWASLGGQAAVAQSAGVHDPANAHMRAEWASGAGRASGEVHAQKSEVARVGQKP